MKCFPIKFLTIFLLLLISCNRSNMWNYETLSSSDISNLTYENSSEIEMEFLKQESEIYCFLNLKQKALSSESEKITFEISTDNKKILASGYLRKGCQKIAIDESTKKFIIKNLINDQTLFISIEDSTEVIYPHFFSKKFKKLLESNSNYTKLINSLF